MRSVAHGIVWFSQDIDRARIEALMRDYCSARRSAYQAIQRGIKGNDIRKDVKRNYSHLGQRYVSDAVSEASKITQPHALFGGKRLWKDFRNGKLSKLDWQKQRNNTLYSRGDRTKQGNPNIRIVGSELWINDPSQHGKWIKGKLWLNKHVDLSCYESRVQWRNGKFDVTISWDLPDVQVKTVHGCGTVGLDVNPDGIALVETNKDGCILAHQYIRSNRAMFAKKGKRDYDIKQIAVSVVNEALQAGKPLVIEDLKFKNKKSKSKRFNRMRHNFLHSQMITAIESRASRYGVEVIRINPAFTSQVGILKYAKPLSLNRHTAAALVIARKGMGLREKVRVCYVESKKERKTLEARFRRIALTDKAYSWMQHLFDVHRTIPVVTPPLLDAGNGARHREDAKAQALEGVLTIAGPSGSGGKLP